MKVKCSPSPGVGSSPHPTLKIVDHHHQLQQHTFTNTACKTSPPLPNNVMPPRSFTPNTHHSSGKYAMGNTNSLSCNDCSLGYCCNISSCCVRSPPPQYSQTPPRSTHSTPAPPYPHSDLYAHKTSTQAVEEPEFVSIDDEKVKQYLIRLGQQQLEKKEQQQHYNQHISFQKEPKITHVFSAPTLENTVKPVVYEIIELDDEDEREKLKQIKQQAEKSLASKKFSPNLSINLASHQTKSLDISLIPKKPCDELLKSSQEAYLDKTHSNSSKWNKSASNHKIIAEIDLIESDEDDPYMNDDGDDDDENDNNDDDEENDDTLPLAAVSCELKCDDEEENNSSSYVTNHSYNGNFSHRSHGPMKYSKPLVDDVVIVGSRENKNCDDMLVRWEEYEGQRERVFFECFLCGKKVQSSYNLRRHMMIHTGSYC